MSDNVQYNSLSKVKILVVGLRLIDARLLGVHLIEQAFKLDGEKNG